MVNPVTYTTPVVSTVNAALPTVVKTPVVSYNYGLHTPLTTGYTGYPHLIKRQTDLEAVAEPRLIKREAEADPLTVVSPYTVPTVNTVARTVVPTVAAKTVIAAPSIYRP